MKLLTLSLVLVLLSFISDSALKAQILYSQNRSSSNRGTPSTQRGPGGTRPPGSPLGNCQPTDHEISLIAPPSFQEITTTEHPILWVYIPYTRDQIHEINFRVEKRDIDRRNQRTIYRTSIAPLEQSGIIGIPLSPETPLLDNQLYEWFFVLNCSERRRGQHHDIILNGFIEKIPVSAQNSDYFSHDIVTNIAQKVLENNGTVAHDTPWQALLKELELEHLIGENIILLPLE
ncbi:DUF928 domain-containing protein [Spirulina subsalsa FACHB-351]|uniref:DUF928 domain-containing protein n=1 Tax=Spirulina subsalsa FACHB-351 TaxID=234711 RepID=A0ABT3L844_9CYAN|nr:DUF928 domain-containing protein [Spirulina subsalsa]MCW6037670.1 DUF928 domain-containing protein [Spirulina subsalsa FACHB-351]